MKVRAAIVILILACVALGVTLVFRNKKAEADRKEHQVLITQHSNSWVSTRQQLEQLQAVNQSLETDLTSARTTTENFSNKLVSVSAQLSQAQAQAKAAAETAAVEMAKRETRISELTGQNSDMLNRMTELNTNLGNLEKLIADTERRLVASEGDREFLLQELKRLQTEKAELERQFHDLAVVREQVRRLRDELSLAQRLEWIRRGIYGSQGIKGGELLMNRGYEPAPKPSYDLSVELKQDGSVTVQPPATNAPPPQ
jgi:chromosome segregation ATPase